MLRTVLAFALAACVVDLAAQAPLTVGRPVRATLVRGDTARYEVTADSAFLIRLTV